MSHPIVNPNRLLPKRSYGTPFGRDYGITSHALLAIDIAFINLLYDAKVVGCAYGLAPSSNPSLPMRVLSLVVQNEIPARQAFEMFKQWEDATDADCLRVEIVILSAGGYLLMIGPEPNRSSVRLAGYGSLFQAISMGHTYVKKIDTTSSGLFDLRDYKKAPISPVMLAAMVTSAREPTANMKLREIDGCPELIKYELTVTEESEARRDPFMASFIDGAKQTNRAKANFAARHEPTPEKLLETRSRMLRQCFPVTIHRIETTPSVLAIKQALMSKGLREWQIDQAICNIQIHDLCHKYALAHVDQEDEDAPLTVLSGRFEDVLSPLVLFDELQLEEQILADMHYLITKLAPHVEVAPTLFESAAQLAHLGALNG